MEKDEKSAVLVTELPTRVAEHEGILGIAPRIYRDYANEFRELARTSGSDAQRALYLKASHMWLDAAARFEMGDFNSGRALPQKPAA